MPKYLTNWIDYQLPTGQEFSVAICGYSGKVRHMYLGHDPIRRAFAQHVYVEEELCQTAEHCLALDCPLNRADPEHLLHMLDMTEDEPSDAETAAHHPQRLDSSAGCHGRGTEDPGQQAGCSLPVSPQSVSLRTN